MGYNYMDAFAGLNGEDAAIVGAVMIIMLIFLVLTMCYAILVYVLQSIGFYSIAKRRGIHYPWLAWIPFGNTWIFGSIGDQYHYVTAGKVKNRRKTLLGFHIAVAVVNVIYSVISSYTTFALVGDGGYTGGTVASSLLMLSLSLILMVLSAIYLVITYMAHHSLYKSCSPNNAAMFTVLGILFGFAVPFFVFALRNRDEGMPPRRTQVPVAPWQPAPAPVWQQPVAPVQQPVDQPADTQTVAYDVPPAEDQN